ncbi:MAG: hypothetical protein AAB363_04215 [Planctomycetota bacterium]
MATASSFWILEIRKVVGVSPIHLLSAWVLIALSAAIWTIRRRNVRAHKRFMVGVMFGLVGAGIGAVTPGRFLTWLLFVIFSATASLSPARAATAKRFGEGAQCKIPRRLRP